MLKGSREGERVGEEILGGHVGEDQRGWIGEVEAIGRQGGILGQSTTQIIIIITQT